MADERVQLEIAVGALELQRAVLGDAVVDASIGVLRAKLAALSGTQVAPSVQQLKQVTILFLDVVGSTAMSRQLDPEEIHAVVDGALARCTQRVERYGGKVLQYAGDNLLAVFGAEESWSPLDDLGEITKQALPRVSVPQQGDEAPVADLTPTPAAWSEEELLREKDFAAYTDAERAAARRLLARIAQKGPQRLSRRTIPTTRRRDEHDLRATIRASLRTGGELLERRYRQQAMRPRRLVLICDVSGSMAPYSRMLLQYMQACVAARARVEAFVFGTRLTRITRELAGRDPDRALARATAASEDWSGGTRIGASLATLNREHGRRIGRGSMVILLSDGWDRGEPEQLSEEMARLARTAYKVIWLNPLAADPRYEPLTRGMKAAMPHVDRLLPGNSISSLEALADLMEAGTA